MNAKQACRIRPSSRRGPRQIELLVGRQYYRNCSHETNSASIVDGWWLWSHKKGRWRRRMCYVCPTPNLFRRPAALEAKLEAKAGASAVVDRLLPAPFCVDLNFFLRLISLECSGSVS